jgi:hypothetical protein
MNHLHYLMRCGVRCYQHAMDCADGTKAPPKPLSRLNYYGMFTHIGMLSFGFTAVHRQMLVCIVLVRILSILWAKPRDAKHPEPDAFVDDELELGE